MRGRYDEDQGFRQFLIYSIIMHASLAVVIVVSAYIQYHAKPWGGVGGDLGGTKVTLVNAPAAGIPMPKQTAVTDSKTVDPTKGLYKEEPPKPPEPASFAVSSDQRPRVRPRRYRRRHSRTRTDSRPWTAMPPSPGHSGRSAERAPPSAAVERRTGRCVARTSKNRSSRQLSRSPIT